MSTPGKLGRNVRNGRWISDVEQLGYVPPCVRDAFSWLPHGFIKHGRGKSARLVWDWQVRDGKPQTPQAPDSERCNRCIFQEPKWSQSYAGCSHSWLHDRDGNCQAFFDRAELIAKDARWAEFCKPPVLDDRATDGDDASALLAAPYLADGTRWIDIQPSCNLPSAYYAQLNNRALMDCFGKVYLWVEGERLRRFWEWARDEVTAETGSFQYNMFLTMV